MRSRFLSKTRTLIAVFDKVHRKGVSLISETDHPDASDDELPLAAAKLELSGNLDTTCLDAHEGMFGLQH